MHDEDGNLVVDQKGRYVLRRAKRKDLPPLSDFEALRHTAAMDCEDAEEARDLRQKDSNVTRTIYRGHLNDGRRELLRRGWKRDTEAMRKHRTAARGSSDLAQAGPKRPACREFATAGDRRQHPAR